jgi:hypothetical protein
MANTTNFNWETPDDTDLVKDGAAAMRTLGNSIDTSFLDLKGGTTGQILSKASNTDLDYTWVTTDDANAIQNAIVDAKGDLIAASAADTPARLAVGNNGETLVADSTAATGLKWAKSANFVGCSLSNSTTQSIANNTVTTVTFDSEFFDTDSFHSTSSNTGRITIPTGLGGKYMVNASMRFDPSLTGTKKMSIFLNGSTELVAVEEALLANDYAVSAKSVILSLAAGDYLELKVSQNSGAALLFYGRNFEVPFSVQYLGA